MKIKEINNKTDRITVYFSRKKLKKLCPVTDWCKLCDRPDWKLLNCHMNEVNYKIKGQK